MSRKSPKTVAEFETEASTIKKVIKMRAKQYDRNSVGTANQIALTACAFPPIA